MSRSLWQALALSGTTGFGTAVGVHPLIGYNDPVHVGPAVAGALLFWVGLILCAGRSEPAGFRGGEDGVSRTPARAY
jgi:hypothetical protein